MRSTVAIIAVLVVTAGCFGGSPSSGRTARLTIVVHGINRSAPWHTTWTLRCAPPAGTHPAPGAACSALADLLAHHAVPPRHRASELGGPWTTVDGLYAGRTIALAYAEACATGRTSLEAQALGAYFAHGGGVHG